ncbi:hypothetical protein Flavo103_39150 [Flavobacterium collinsii]|nr:hypothetical protein Flavo103_39150 [Flavobacterium collinsii]
MVSNECMPKWGLGETGGSYTSDENSYKNLNIFIIVYMVSYLIGCNSESRSPKSSHEKLCKRLLTLHK